MSYKKSSELVQEICIIAETKSKTHWGRWTVMGFMAGAYVAFGAAVAIAVGKGITAPGWIGLSKFMFAAVFPVALILVIIGGAELFTGNCMVLPIGCFSKKTTWKLLFSNWIIVYIANFIGSIFIAWLIYKIGLFSSEPYTSSVIAIAQKKVSLNFTQAFLSGVGCNWLVALAVWLAVSADDISSKILAIWFPIMAFAAIGFEHSVANMFFIPLGIFHGSQLANWGNFFTSNLIPVTLGNIVGAFVFVGTAYFWVYKK